jgi:hypothetical protein
MSWYRNGASRVTRLVASVVYGFEQGKHWAGAPVTPEKTWFQTPLDQPPIWLLRTRNCCCEPLTTVPVNCESAIKPPLVKFPLQ